MDQLYRYVGIDSLLDDSIALSSSGGIPSPSSVGAVSLDPGRFIMYKALDHLSGYIGIDHSLDEFNPLASPDGVPGPCSGRASFLDLGGFE
jgi:hypothetical protein